MRFADRELLAELVALLPPYLVNVREGGAVSPFVRSLAAALIERALCEGHEIDRTNGDGPLYEWDGWLVISVPGKPIFLQIAGPGGGPIPKPKITPLHQGA